MHAAGGDEVRNKRNVDFHELFPTVPEDDCLIEGGFFMCQKYAF